MPLVKKVGRGVAGYGGLAEGIAAGVKRREGGAQ